MIYCRCNKIPDKGGCYFDIQTSAAAEGQHASYRTATRSGRRRI